MNCTSVPIARTIIAKSFFSFFTVYTEATPLSKQIAYAKPLFNLHTLYNLKYVSFTNCLRDNRHNLPFESPFIKYINAEYYLFQNIHSTLLSELKKSFIDKEIIIQKRSLNNSQRRSYWWINSKFMLPICPHKRIIAGFPLIHLC